MNDTPRGTFIPGLSLTRPVTTVMGFIALLVMGWVAWRNIDVELLPSGFTPPFLFAQIPTLRSSPEDIEQRIAVPTEEMLATVRNLDRLATRINTNSASFIMEFADGTDMNDAYNQVRDRIERVLPQFGNDIGQYFIWKYNPADEPVVWLGASFADADDPGRLIDDYVVPRLERIPGVSRVEVSGAPQRVVAIQVNERMVDAAGTTMFDLIQSLSRDNFGLSAGQVEQDGALFPLRVVARWESLQDMRALPVGQGLTLDDIADIAVEDRAERSMYRVNGRPSIWLEVYKESTANSVEVARSVQQTLDLLPSRYDELASAEFSYFFNQADIIEESLGNLESSAWQGALFAIVVLFLFLRHVRMTALITMAIPVSMLGTIVVLYFTGRTLNVLSLMGLMLVVGMVVDNAIVVVESVQRHRQMGKSSYLAALHGAGEVALAILVSTLTTVVVFVPIILMSGDQMLSFFLGQIGFPVCVGLVASLVVALTLLPLATARLVPGHTPAPPRVIVWLENGYARLLDMTLRRRLEATLLAALVFASTWYPMSRVTVTDQSESAINDFRIFVEMPQSFTWQERVDVMLEYEATLGALREELGVRSVVSRVGGRWGRPNVRCFLVPSDERPLEVPEIIERAHGALRQIPGVRTSLSWQSGAGATDSLTVSIAGPDSRRLAEMAEEVSRRLRFIEGVSSVRAESGEDGQPEMHFVVDRERALQVGLTPQIVGGTIDFALRGRQVGRLPQDDGELPVFLEGQIASYNEMDELSGMELPSPMGTVTLDSVSSSQESPGFRSIDRENRRTAISLTIYTTREDLEALSDEIDAAMAGFDWPRGYGLDKGRRFMDVSKGAADRLLALTLSVTFVFLLMGILFESFVLPLSILLSIPFAFTGVYWGLWLTETSMDMMAGVGLVILVGIVVNNAIVLVDVVGDRQREGLTRHVALVEAGRERLRPILMTALTTIFGLIPMAMGNAAVAGVPYKPLGITVMGGLVASTLLTLFVVPLFYTFFDDMRLGARDWLAALLNPTVARRAATDPGATPDASSDAP